MFAFYRPVLITFFLCLGISFGIAQPANDACPNAINIPNVNNFCSANGAGTSVNATDDVATTGGFGAAGCWGTGAVQDVWFKFTAVATDVTITIRGNEGVPTGGSINRPQVALYSGVCSGTLNELVCGSAPAGQNIIQIYRGGLTIGQTYLVRVDGFNTNRGTFQYCINNYFPVPTPNGDCPTGVVLCDKNGFSVPDVTGAGSNTTEMNSAACFDYDPLTGNVESSSTWYVFTIAASGTLTFNITPSNADDDIDFALFRLPNGIGNCGGKVTVRCMASSCTGTTGLNSTSSDTDEPPGCVFPQDNYVSQVNVTAGQTYALAINNFTSTGNGFNITFGGTAQFQGPVSVINDSDADDQICIGESITYTDASAPPPSGTITSWTWNFGTDATPATSTQRNPPSVTYSTAGVKTVTLTVRSDRGCLVTSTKNITVGASPLGVSISPSANPVCAGTNVTFTATPVNAGASPVYQWYLNGNPVGSNSPAYSNTGLNNNDQVRVVVTASGLCISGSPATSNTVTMTVNPRPNVTVNSPSICGGATATLTASGASTYTWSSGLPNGATVTTPVLNNNTSYTVTGTDANGCTNTATANVTILSNPNVTVNSPTICAGQTATLTASGASTYTWSGGLPNGASVTTPVLNNNTSYTVTGTDANGCTNTATATVTVRALPNVTVNSPGICTGSTATLTAAGASTYTWSGGLPNGATVTTPVLSGNTSYTVTGTDANGCSNTATANVTVNPLPSVTVNSPVICAGQTATLTAAGATSYTWSGGLPNGANVTTPVLNTTTSYTVTGSNGGCSNTAVATVTVNPLPNVTVNSPTICAGQTATLTASGASTYTWSAGLPPGTTVNTPVLNANTSYTVTGTDINGCTNAATATVTVNALPNVTVNSPVICEGNTATLTAAGASTYTWSGGLPNGATVTTPVLNSTTGYTVTGTDANGCSNTATSTVTVNQNTSTALVQTICQGESYTVGSQAFSVSGNYTVLLKTSAGCDSTVTLALTVNPVKTTNLRQTICEGQSVTIGGQTFPNSGVYSVRLQTSLGCDSTVVLDLTVNPQLIVEVSVAASNSQICAGEAVTFTATPVNGGSNPVYQWFYNGSPVGTNSPVYSKALLNEGDSVFVQLTSSETCTGVNPAFSEPVNIRVSRLDYTKPVMAYCSGSDPVLDLNIPQTGYVIDWQHSGITQVTTNTDQVTLTDPVSGTASFTIRFGNNFACSISDTVNYTVYPLPVIDAGADRNLVKYGESVQLSVDGQSGYVYQWLPAAPLDSDTAQDPVATITSPTWFIVTAASRFGCLSSDSVWVDMTDECSEDYVFVPNGFTPNYDGLNDCFGILYVPPHSEFKLVIFNRWGEKLYEASDVNSCWDGLYKGQDALVDGYTYIIGFRCYDGKFISKTGTFTLIR